MKINEIPEDELWRQYKANPTDLTLRNELVQRNLHLVSKVVSRMTARLPIDDMNSMATLGLIRAVELFDPDREIRFGSYAWSRMKGSILDEIRALDIVPRNVRQSNRATGTEEPAMVSLSMMASKQVDGDGAPTTLGEGLVDEGDSPDDALTYALMKDALAKAIAALPHRTASVMEALFVEGWSNKRLAEVTELSLSTAHHSHFAVIAALHLALNPEATFDRRWKSLSDSYDKLALPQRPERWWRYVLDDDTVFFRLLQSLLLQAWPRTNRVGIDIHPTPEVQLQRLTALFPSIYGDDGE